jgi:hypothetical protein
MDIEKIKQAIKAQKWDKASYIYALEGMNLHSYGAFDMRKKPEVIEIFYRHIQEPVKWARIKDYTTFRNL